MNKIILLLRKVVYPYECMNELEKFDEKALPKNNFYCNFNMKDINMKDIKDVDYAHAKRICKDFEIKKIRLIT